jgi:nucleotide-binding universal stress UspA family protein
VAYLVAYDGSPASRDAVALVVRLARGAEVVALTGPDAPPLAGVTHRPLGDVREAAAGADLIAVSRGPFAQGLAKRAPCPVLVVPPHAPAQVATVGAAFDGRPQSRPALNTAIALAGDLGARLLVLGVRKAAPPPTGLPTGGGEDDFEHMLAKVSFSTHGGSGHRVLTGRPGPALVAASADVDLLAVGASRPGLFGGGKVSRHLVEHAACAVLVVPRP